jgi:hypothetical protein
MRYLLMLPIGDKVKYIILRLIKAKLDFMGVYSLKKKHMTIVMKRFCIYEMRAYPPSMNIRLVTCLKFRIKKM